MDAIAAATLGVSVAAIVFGWVVRIERRTMGIFRLHRNLDKLDRRTLRILMKVDPLAAAEELRAEDNMRSFS
jgi:hypothetical protein